jgi:hypothetical protein
MNKLQITAKEKSLLNEMVASIIPEGELPGAKSLKVDNFVWVMVDDCLPKEQQNSFMNGLKLFDSKVKEISRNSFVESDTGEKIKILNAILDIDIEKDETNKKSNIKDLQNFIKTTKYYTGRGYLQSEYIMTEIMPYQLVPGTYGVCETIEKNQRINING